MSNIIEKLILVQSEVKVPKNSVNSYGGFNYRSVEDILETVKPILKKYNLLLTLRDEIEGVGERVYIKGIAALRDVDNSSIETYAYAREMISKKKMDDSQMTGCASSYARKYALNGLFALDDTKDADTNEFQQEKIIKERMMTQLEKCQKTAEERASHIQPLTEAEKTEIEHAIWVIANEKKLIQSINEYLQKQQVTELRDLPDGKLQEIYERIKRH